MGENRKKNTERLTMMNEKEVLRDHRLKMRRFSQRRPAEHKSLSWMCEFTKSYGLPPEME